MIDLLSFMGGALQTGTLKSYECKVTFKKAKNFSVQYLDFSHHRMIDLLSFMEGDPFINGNPKVVYVQSQF